MSTSLRMIRQELRLSQSALASAANVPLPALKRWERGLETAPDEAIERLAVALGRPRHEILRAFDDQGTGAEIGEGYVTARNDDELVLYRRISPEPKRIRVLDLFCGTGGFSYGFERTECFAVTAGIDLLHDRVNSFHRNHPNAMAIAADIRRFPTHTLGDHAMNPAVVIGGPPCQGFSSIRPFRTLTESDSRNSLPEYFLLVLRELRPKWFVFENVVGLLTTGGGKFLFELLELFPELGYRVDWRVINAASYGLPQHRERVIVVGNNVGRQFAWPSPTHELTYRSMAGARAKLIQPEPIFSGALAPPVTVMDAIGDLPPVEAGQSVTTYDEEIAATPYQSRMRNRARVLTLHAATAHSAKMLAIIRLAGKNRAALPEGMTTSGFSSCYSRLTHDEPSTTITVNFVHPSSNRCIHPFQDRALTPREGARLQSFPDTFEFAGGRAQVVKQIGNAVPPLLGEVLARAIAEQF